jgi:hypothetical protein
MIHWSACQQWPPDQAANAAQESSSYTTPRDTIDSDLFENRDLKATTDLRAVLKGLLRDHLRVEDRALATVIFPDSEGVHPIEGCVA